MKIFTVCAAVVGLLIAFCLASWISKSSEGTDRMKEIAGYIREGAMAFPKRVQNDGHRHSSAFLADRNRPAELDNRSSICMRSSSFCFGRLLRNEGSTNGNVRTANAAMESGMNKALKIAFRSGAVMGLCVSGLGLFGLGVVVCVLDLATVTQCVTGFGLGASSMALFGRVGGGIYTKAADVGADLVGKVEAGIPEDDPRNPAVIADNVGDNVGDVAGMGSDLFESYVGSIISAITLAAVAVNEAGEVSTFSADTAAIFPLIISAVGVLASIIGILCVRGKEGKEKPCQRSQHGYLHQWYNRSCSHRIPVKEYAGRLHLCSCYHRRSGGRYSYRKDHRSIHFCGL